MDSPSKDRMVFKWVSNYAWESLIYRTAFTEDEVLVQHLFQQELSGQININSFFFGADAAAEKINGQDFKLILPRFSAGVSYEDGFGISLRQGVIFDDVIKPDTELTLGYFGDYSGIGFGLRIEEKILAIDNLRLSNQFRLRVLYGSFWSISFLAASKKPHLALPQ